MTTYSPETAARLVREGREDDERMTPGPWDTAAERNCPRAIVRAGTEQIADAFNHTHWTDGQCAANAAAIARTRNNLPELVAQLEAAMGECERLTNLIADSAKDDVDPEVWRGYRRMAARHMDERDAATADRNRLSAENERLRDDRRCAFQDRDRLAAEVENLSKNGPAWLRFALQCLHAQVDRTDPDDPVGAALTRAGLERLGADYGPEHAAHLARLSLTPEEVEALRFARDTVSAGTHGAAFGLWTSAYQDRYFSALATLDRLLAAAQERK